MTNQQILEKAIQKAIDGGWTPRIGLVAFESEHGKRYKNVKYIPINHRIEALIFSHDFAKALWGESNLNAVFNNEESEVRDGWQYHLQQMVIDPNPIEYLGRHLDD